MNRNSLNVVAMIAMSSIGITGVLFSPVLAERRNPSSCYQYSPEWDQAEITEALLEKSTVADPIVKERQLKEFSALKQTHDAYYNGTAPICEALAKFEAKCSDVNTRQEQESCQSWADQINAAGIRINTAWKVSLSKFITEANEAISSQTAVHTTGE